ncbi:proline-rich nuclear receptor coactivator [Tasmannia lanceolata]|uniref:proline-rich nuclear receptor coactivator n=1 Tax=Tasmannia lanceolata TaxID=3420 RepID=UPI0040636747
MGTEILRPQDCLIERLRLTDPLIIYPRRKTYPRPGRKSDTRPEIKKRVQTKQNLSVATDDSRSGKNLVLGQVTILKRGESLDSKKKNHGFETRRTVSGGDLVVFGTERIGPDPDLVPKQIRLTDLKSALSPVYAGSAFSFSPSPSSLPLPSFSKKKEGKSIINDSATKDLRRLLRLE